LNISLPVFLTPSAVLQSFIPRHITGKLSRTSYNVLLLMRTTLKGSRVPQGQVTSRVFSRRCWMVALIGQSLGTQPHSITSPLEATAISRVIPYTLQPTPTHRPLFCISLPSLHSGQTPGHSPRFLSLFVPFSCIAFASCFPSLSFISLVSMFATIFPSAPASQIPTLPLFDIYRIASLPILIIDVVIVIKRASF